MNHSGSGSFGMMLGELALSLSTGVDGFVDEAGGGGIAHVEPRRFVAFDRVKVSALRPVRSGEPEVLGRVRVANGAMQDHGRE